MGRGPKGAIGLGGAGQGKAVPRLEARRWETANEPSIAEDIVEVSCTDNQSQTKQQKLLKRGKSTSDQVANLPMLEPNDQSSNWRIKKREKNIDFLNGENWNVSGYHLVVKYEKEMLYFRHENLRQNNLH